eukprot:365279-Chlamydomonas_euryale.AAC.13
MAPHPKTPAACAGKTTQPPHPSLHGSPVSNLQMARDMFHTAGVADGGFAAGCNYQGQWHLRVQPSGRV